MLKPWPLARIAVFVSGGGTNLQALIDARDTGTLKHGELALVVSNNADAFALTRAERAGIPCAVVPHTVQTGDYEDKLIALMDEYKIDLIVLAGFLVILSERFTARYDHRILNVHPSLIPSFCGKGFYGLRVHEAALSRGVTLTGATVHFVNEIPDGGDIVLQKAVAVREGDTPKILQERVMREAEWVILPRAVELVSRQLRRKNAAARKKQTAGESADGKGSI